MRIAIDGTTLTDASGGVGAGIEHYTWEIIRALLQLNTPHTFIVSIPRTMSIPRLRSLADGINHRSVRFVKEFGPDISFFSHHLFLPVRFGLAHVQVLFAPSGQLPLGWLGKSVITVHDVAIYEHPEWFTALGEQNFSTRVVVPKSLARASHILAVSETTKQRLEKVFSNTKNKTSVVYEGVNVPKTEFPQNSSTQFPFDRDFILFLGTVEPRKNLAMAISAFDLFLQQHPEFINTCRFVIAGKNGWGTQEVFQLIEEVNQIWAELEPNGVIHYLGAVTEEEKWLLLARASLFIYPSFYEGFGLPILEAMAIGTPVIISQESALCEVGREAVITIEFGDIESMALSIAQCLLLPEGVKMLCDDGIARAKYFSWEQTAQETLRILEQVGKN